MSHNSKMIKPLYGIIKLPNHSLGPWKNTRIFVSSKPLGGKMISIPAGW